MDTNLYLLIFSLGAMMIVFIVCGVKFNFYMFWIPVVLIQIYIFSIGLGLLLAQGCVFFRDIQHIYAAVLTAWNYLTPIFYPIEQLPEHIKIKFHTAHNKYNQHSSKRK